MRGGRGSPWHELGDFQSISLAAERVLELENDANGALFFRVYVDTITEEQSDAEILCRLEYQAANSFYLLTRTVS